MGFTEWMTSISPVVALLALVEGVIALIIAIQQSKDARKSKSLLKHIASGVSKALRVEENSIELAEQLEWAAKPESLDAFLRLLEIELMGEAMKKVELLYRLADKASMTTEERAEFKNAILELRNDIERRLRRFALFTRSDKNLIKASLFWFRENAVRSDIPYIDRALKHLPGFKVRELAKEIIEYLKKKFG